MGSEMCIRDSVSSLWLAAFYKVMPRQLERGFHRFRSAATEEDVADLRRRVGNEIVGQFLRHPRAEKAGVRVSQFVELLVHGGKNIWMRVPQTGNRRAARSINIFLAGAVKNPDADAALGDGVRMAGLSMKDPGHHWSSEPGDLNVPLILTGFHLFYIVSRLWQIRASTSFVLRSFGQTRPMPIL